MVSPSRPSSPGWRASVALGLAWALGACGGGGGAGAVDFQVGSLQAKPAGAGFYLADPHRGGTRSRLGLSSVSWGQLVDVHDVDPSGALRPQPVLRDFVIQESVPGGGDYQFDVHPITRRSRLVIRRTRGAPDDGRGTFEELLAAVSQRLIGVLPKSDRPSTPGPFSYLPRNATLVLRFNDLLDDGEQGRRGLEQAVRVLTGYGPQTPFTARVLFDPNHGGLLGDEFHSTRVLVDLTISEVEAADGLSPLPLNALGLPPSQVGVEAPNVALRLATRTDPSAGVFHLLRSVTGKALSSSSNGPVDLGVPTVDVVRAMRAGNAGDVGNGFLIDLAAPEVVGDFPIEVRVLDPDPFGESGFDFLCDLAFQRSCAQAAQVGDVIGVGDRLFEVRQSSGPPTPESAGRSLLRGVRLRSLSSDPLASPASAQGFGSFFTLFEPQSQVPGACWFRFDPAPTTGTALGVDPQARISVRFNEPMDPSRVAAFESLTVEKGGVSAPQLARDTVVGTIETSEDLREFTFVPRLGFAHRDEAELYHVQLVGGGDRGLTDLSGNAPADLPPVVEFRLEASAPANPVGGFVLRFEEPSEFGTGSADLRGQVFLDVADGVLRPRPPGRALAAVDRVNPVPGIMFPFSLGVQSPLSPLGSKLQMVWRYCDFGWLVTDESSYNLDIEGMYWAPVGGQAIPDYFERFEIRMAHSLQNPDEFVGNLVGLSGSGLYTKPNFYTRNILDDPLGEQQVVHAASLGYVVDPADLQISPGGVPLMPYPFNRSGAAYRSYTWRDTTILAQGGEFSGGLPLYVEVEPPISLYGGIAAGSLAQPGKVPSYGLPLLVEFRCYPSDEGVGLNALDISLALNSRATPNFRAYSTGGIDDASNRVPKDPDLELQPSGGFNPRSNPPGRPTRRQADNSLYMGAVDTVVRVSRAHSIWFQADFATPDYEEALFEPPPEAWPPGTRIEVDYRGARGFPVASPGFFDAGEMDPYGNVAGARPDFFQDRPTWSTEVDELDGAPFLQLRLSFVNNVHTGSSLTLSGLGIAYREGL